MVPTAAHPSGRSCSGVVEPNAPSSDRPDGRLEEDPKRSCAAEKVLSGRCRTSLLGEQTCWGEPAEGAYLAGEVRLVGVTGIG